MTEDIIDRLNVVKEKHRRPYEIASHLLAHANEGFPQTLANAAPERSNDVESDPVFIKLINAYYQNFGATKTEMRQEIERQISDFHARKMNERTYNALTNSSVETAIEELGLIEDEDYGL